jgi:hypothetical protein
VAQLSGDELSYLTGELTERGDWQALWRLAQYLPLARAAHHAMRMGTSGWVPSDDRDRALFTLLLGANNLHVTSPGWAEPGRWPDNLSAVHDRALRALAARPLAAMRPADLKTATWLLRARNLGPARAFAQTLKACLEVRFGTEVALGEAAAPRPGADDVGPAAGDSPHRAGGAPAGGR